MATKTTCDFCKNDAVGKVRVTVEVENAVEGTKVTGRTEEFDSCPGCRSKAIVRAYGDASKIILEHIPAQRRLEHLRGEIRELRQRRTSHANTAGSLEDAIKNTDPKKVLESNEIAATLVQAQERLAYHLAEVGKIDAALEPLISERKSLMEATGSV